MTPGEKGVASLRADGDTTRSAGNGGVSLPGGAGETNLDLTGLRQLIYGCGGQSGLFPSIRAVYLGGVCTGHGGADDQRHGGDDYRGQAPLWGDHRPDRRRGSCLLFGGVLLAGHLLCCLAFVQSTALSVVNVLCLGLGYPIATMGPSVWSNDLAAPEQYPVVVRRLQVIYAGGALLFASLPGLLADRLGGYIPAYLLFSAIIALTLLCIALAYRSGGRDR